jgi:hypothetical protein
LLYSMPKLVQQYVKITPQGLKFLEQNSSE